MTQTSTFYSCRFFKRAVLKFLHGYMCSVDFLRDALLDRKRDQFNGIDPFFALIDAIRASKNSGEWKSTSAVLFEGMLHYDP